MWAALLLPRGGRRHHSIDIDNHRQMNVLGSEEEMGCEKGKVAAKDTQVTTG